MNTIRMLAWGMLDLDDKRLTKQQRRMYIQRIRKELEPYNMTLQVGGPSGRACYRLLPGLDHQNNDNLAIAYHYDTYPAQYVQRFGQAMLNAIKRIEDTRRGNDAA